MISSHLPDSATIPPAAAGPPAPCASVRTARITDTAPRACDAREMTIRIAMALALLGAAAGAKPKPAAAPGGPKLGHLKLKPDEGGCMGYYPGTQDRFFYENTFALDGKDHTLKVVTGDLAGGEAEDDSPTEETLEGDGYKVLVHFAPKPCKSQDESDCETGRDYDATVTVTRAGKTSAFTADGYCGE